MRQLKKAPSPLPPISYAVLLDDRAGQYFHVSLLVPAAVIKSIRQTSETGVFIRMPAWIPGSYMIRDFARHVHDLSASTPFEQIDKDTWHLAFPSSKTQALRVNYKVHAKDQSVRGAYLGDDRAFFNGTSLFFQLVHAPKETAYQLDIQPPRSHSKIATTDWKIATSLPSVKVDSRGFGRFLAKNYDELIDHPVEISDFIQFNFKAGHCSHSMAISGLASLSEHVDMARLKADTQAIVEAQIEFFDPVQALERTRSARAPMRQYWFLLNTLADGYGGLEHRESTALLSKRSDLPFKGTAPGLPYHDLLGLISHEYFHSWLVKRIQPKAFKPYALDQENYNRLLWLFEGFTSYYDDLFLYRCGRINLSQYLARVAKSICATWRAPGTSRDTVASSSFNAWTRYYRQDESSPNHLVSYYATGSLVALCLDLRLRQSKGAGSLDDVMYALWQRADQGLGENEFSDIVSSVSGLNLAAELQQWTQTSVPLPVQALLELEGFIFEYSSEQWAALRCRVGAVDQGLKLHTVYEGGPAHAAGLITGDTIIAVAGLKCQEQLLKIQLAQFAGRAMPVHFFRADRLLETTIQIPHPAELPKHEVKISRKSGDRRHSWPDAIRRH
jgi:predicted metalloprotease with PDZ domain